MSKKSTSSFWLDRFFRDDSITESWDESKKSSYDLVRLAQAKRAVGNFVSIVTNQSIPVKFRTDDQSYTDGKTVVIGSNITKPEDFDVAVGLALHEGSHIKLSDFDLLLSLDTIVRSDSYDAGTKAGFSSSETRSIIKDLWNVVEDRRIDDYIYRTAPGYRGYYQAMYGKYFNSEVIDTALKSDKHTEEDLNSYMFRIINIHNKNTRVKALKQLPAIYKCIGLGTIDRLKSSQDTFDVAVEVFQLIMEALSNPQKQQDDSSSDEGDGEGNTDQGEQPQSSGEQQESSCNSEGGSADDGTSASDGDSSDEGQTSTGTDTDDDEDGDTDDFDYEGKLKQQVEENQESEPIEFDELLADALQEAIEQQKSFVDGEIEKEALDDADSKEMDNIEESGTDTVNVGDDVDGNYSGESVNCIVVKKLTPSLLKSETFPLTEISYSGELTRPFETEVSKGIQLGTTLGKKLQVRAESRNTVFNRQKHGKIDKRMISSLGFGNENVFYYNEIDQYNKANLHFSIDASSSMSGITWRNTMINVTAICKAVDIIQNLEIQVSIRTTSKNTSAPYVVMAYDSRVDKFSKVREMFPSLRPRGTTPEGLCFEAIEQNFIPSSNTMDSYFVNISDGEPYYGGAGFRYSGESAFRHTREQVKKLRNKGIQVLSYFVSDSGRQEHDNFKRMYGKSSRFVDVTNISDITKTMNELFLKK